MEKIFMTSAHEHSSSIARLCITFEIYRDEFFFLMKFIRKKKIGLKVKVHRHSVHFMLPAKTEQKSG